MLPPRSALLRSGAVLAGLALVLSACGEDKKDEKEPDTKASEAPAACEDVESGETSESVKVAGAFGKTQTATFESPLSASELQRTVVTEGSGDVPEADETIEILLSVYSGKSGDSLGSQKTELTVGDAQVPDAFRAGVDCVKVGSRAVVTVAAKDVYGEEGNPQAGIAADDSLVIVTDVLGPRPELKPSAWSKNAPEVTFAADGKPTMKLPGKKPASTLMLKVLRPGDGDVVGKGDSVTLDYQGTSWDTGKIFDQSYGKAPATFTTDGVVPGFGAALVGQKVGTRLVVTIPPEHAYGPKGSGSELGGQTLVFVIEIKATEPV